VGKDCVELVISDSTEYNASTGRKNDIYCFKISRHCEGWQFRVMDFFQYNAALNRNVIYNGPDIFLEEVRITYTGHSIHDNYLRPYEPEILVHSTTPEGYTHIMKDGAIKSWNKVKTEHKIYEDKPIGTLLGDPDDFRDYIMLGDTGFWNEIVVSSREKGFICMDADAEYKPGARFYFNTKQLLENGLYLRDGIHYKVKDELPLSYVLFTASLENISLKGKITPSVFSGAADTAFYRYIKNI